MHTVLNSLSHHLLNPPFIRFTVKVKKATIFENLLAGDITYSSTIVVRQARQLNLNDTQVTSLAHAAVGYFCGDHQQCTKLAGSSCAGMPEKNWMLCSSLYREAGDVHIHFNEQERKKSLKYSMRFRHTTKQGFQQSNQLKIT